MHHTRIYNSCIVCGISGYPGYRAPDFRAAEVCPSYVTTTGWQGDRVAGVARKVAGWQGWWQGSSRVAGWQCVGPGWWQGGRVAGMQGGSSVAGRVATGWQRSR